MSRFQQIQFKHCHRQANRHAHMLVGKGAVQDLEIVSFESSLIDILSGGPMVIDGECVGYIF